METPQRSSAVPAIGLAFIILGGLGILAGAMGSVIFNVLFPLADLDADEMMLTNADVETINNLGSLGILFALGIPFGALYIVAGIYLRQYKLWANRLLCVLLGVGMFVAPVNVYFAFRDNTGRIAEQIHNSLIASTIEQAIPAIALIWFLNSKYLRPHFS